MVIFSKLFASLYSMLFIAGIFLLVLAVAFLYYGFRASDVDRIILGFAFLLGAFGAELTYFLLSRGL